MKEAKVYIANKIVLQLNDTNNQWCVDYDYNNNNNKIQNATVTVTLYVSIENEIPVALIVPSIGNYFDGSIVTFATFTEKNDNDSASFPSYLFHVPSYCP